jgi:hypothetical protein
VSRVISDPPLSVVSEPPSTPTFAEEGGRTFNRLDRQIDFAPAEELTSIRSEAGFGAPARFYQAFLWASLAPGRVGGTKNMNRWPGSLIKSLSETPLRHVPA